MSEIIFEHTIASTTHPRDPLFYDTGFTTARGPQENRARCTAPHFQIAKLGAGGGGLILNHHTPVVLFWCGRPDPVISTCTMPPPPYIPTTARQTWRERRCIYCRWSKLGCVKQAKLRPSPRRRVRSGCQLAFPKLLQYIGYKCTPLVLPNSSSSSTAVNYRYVGQTVQSLNNRVRGGHVRDLVRCFSASFDVWLSTHSTKESSSLHKQSPIIAKNGDGGNGRHTPTDLRSTHPHTLSGNGSNTFFLDTHSSQDT